MHTDCASNCASIAWFIIYGFLLDWSHHIMHIWQWHCMYIIQQMNRSSYFALHAPWSMIIIHDACKSWSTSFLSFPHDHIAHALIDVCKPETPPPMYRKIHTVQKSNFGMQASTINRLQYHSTYVHLCTPHPQSDTHTGTRMHAGWYAIMQTMHQNHAIMDTDIVSTLTLYQSKATNHPVTQQPMIYKNFEVMKKHILMSWHYNYYNLPAASLQTVSACFGDYYYWCAYATTHTMQVQCMLGMQPCPPGT